MSRGPSLLRQVRSELERVCEPARAPAMQVYMKSAMPYHGVAAGPARAVFRAVFADLSFWKRRSAIISQLKFKEETDVAFLYACIEPSLASKEFFLRKAIGWALRQLAWTMPDEVQRYVGEHEAELSNLSRREALNNVAKTTQAKQ